MKRCFFVSIAQLVLVGSTVGLSAAESETFAGAAAASGTYKRPQLLVDGKRYELKASDNADRSVAKRLAEFSKGDTGTYLVKGTRGTVNGVAGIIIDGITVSSRLAETGPSARPDPHRYKSYEYTEAGRTLRLIIPADLAVVRGILVVGPYARADSRDYYQQVWYREFMHLHGFAFLGAHWPSSSHAENFKTMQHALKQLAADSKHPELVNAPYAATGFSAGGGFASRLLVEAPGRVIASVIVGSRLKLTDIKPTAAHLDTPACIINGENEHGENEQGGMAAVVEPVLAEHRPNGARWGWMAVPGGGHEFNGQEVLAMPLLDAAVRLRYPADGDVCKGPLKLKSIAPQSGWVADNTTWRSGLTDIAAASDFKGAVMKSSWLLNQDLAFIYRAYSTYDRPLKITSPHPMSAQGEVWDAGSSVVISIDDSKFAGWKKLELFDGAKKVSELTKGPAEFTVHDQQPGYHAFSILGTDNKGNIRPSNPVLVVVRNLTATSQPAD
ncbi:hypothetical protein SAMN05444166_7152 [Singulisphaera sp. GP187]|nr:hypothetical protein SAMN05444166_7152 [Singulisphaera sp. GP187]